MTIVDDIVAGINIARTNILATTMRKDPRSIQRRKIQRTIPGEL
jgi:hypothetical protein